MIPLLGIYLAMIIIFLEMEILCLHKSMYVDLCSSIIHNQKLELAPLGTWVNKLCYIHTMDELYELY